MVGSDVGSPTGWQTTTLSVFSHLEVGVGEKETSFLVSLLKGEKCYHEDSTLVWRITLISP